MINMQSFRDPDRQIGALATEQHGVVARRQLTELGLTPQHIAYRIDIGRLIRVFRGVYAVGHPRLTREGRWMGVLLDRLAGANVADTRSALEVALLQLCDDNGLPAPLANVPIAGFTVDFHWPGTNLIVETDGFTYHRMPTTFESDRDRDQLLMLAGYRVARFTYNQLTRQRTASAVRLRELLAGSGSRNDE